MGTQVQSQTDISRDNGTWQEGEILRGRDPGIRALIAMLSIARWSEAHCAASLPEGVTTAQYLALQYVSVCKAAPRISELANRVGVSQPTMSSTLRKLEARGLVEFVVVDGDRRAKGVALTALGEKSKRTYDLFALPALRELVNQVPASVWESLLPGLMTLHDSFPQHFEGEGA